MTLNVASSAITASTGTLTLEEGSKNIKVKSGQVIVTDNYVTSGTYVFKKGQRVPMAYFATRRTAGSTGTFIFNTSAGTVGSLSNSSAEVVLPTYFTQLAKAISSSGLTPTYYISACVSSLSPTATVGTTEKTYYTTNKGFNKSAYSSSNRAPVLRVNAEKVPNSNSYVKGTMSSANIQFTVSQSNYSFISLVVQL